MSSFQALTTISFDTTLTDSLNFHFVGYSVFYKYTFFVNNSQLYLTYDGNVNFQNFTPNYLISEQPYLAN